VIRVVSGAVLFLFALGVVWLAPDAVFFVVAELLVALACVEYASIARASGLALAAAPAAVAAMLTCSAFTRTLSVALDVVLMTALVAIGALSLTLWRGGREALAVASAGLFPALYLGLPVGALVAVREIRGREALFLLILAVSASDTAQYYSGRAFGRTPLAPAISPKKTVEGAVGGLAAGVVVLVAIGAWWLPTIPWAVRAVLGLAIAVLGITGDLFESMLKRSASLKDSSALIPGHGGLLDRIDALLFAAPVYYVVLRYV
jgi:phosphatidate cytidylyltransferase